MQQFVVPQFIDVEDKIFGPITTRQFLILLVAGGLIYLSFELFDFALFIICTAFIGGFSLVLAFVKINGQPFHYFMLNFFESVHRPAIRVWGKVYSHKELDYLRKLMPETVEEQQMVKPVSRERIRDLSLLVNTGGYYKPDDVL